MTFGQRIRRKLRHLHGDASTPGGGKQTDASAPSSVSIAQRQSMPASTTGITASQTQPPLPPVDTKVQSEPESRSQSSPVPIRLDRSASLPEHLWDRAYDDLKVHEAALVQAYEKILSGKLCDRNLESAGDVYEDEENIIAHDDPGARRAQMERLVTSGLAKVTREARIKDNIGTGVQVIMSAKDIISSAIQAIPQAALPWAGVCVALEILGNSLHATAANRNGIRYVVDRMEWYWALPDVILKRNTGAYKNLSKMESRVEIQLIDLYKALLLYQIKSVCSYYKNRGLVFLRDIAKLDNWDGDINAIQNAEASFLNDSNVHREERMNANLEQLVAYAEKQMTKEDHQCFKDLGVTDPKYDKKRIEKTKGGLLKESYRWILDNPDFLQWRDDKQRRLLWIKGDPGKGKTMLLCGIADELRKSSNYSGPISYFLCQATDQRINNAVAVLWGLMFMLVDQQPSLMSHIRKRYDMSGKELFTGDNAWIALSDIFSDMLSDPALTTAYLLIDALDECVSDRERLLDLVVENLSAPSCVKWILSSRNWPEIERRLAESDDAEKTSLSLEVNADVVSRAVDAYIEHEISQLILLKHNPTLKGQVRHQMQQKANGTFLWVALVIKDLRDRQDAEYEDPSHILSILMEIPSDLTALYSRMIDHIGKLGGDAPKLCQKILSIAALARRPLNLAELGILADFGSHLTNGPTLARLVNKCGSFLTIRDSTVYFVHQSAKEHLTTNERTQSTIFPFGHKDVHYTIFSRSLQAMAKALRKDIYTLEYPGFLVEEIETPNPDPLAAVRYSCTHWITHLCEGFPHNSITTYRDDLSDVGVVFLFLHKHFLHWLEALSLLRNVSNGVILITRLESLLKIQSPESQLFILLQDAHRFILHNKSAIELAPLQTYSSALIFSPTRSLIRRLFCNEVPSWIGRGPTTIDDWSPCLQTLEGHSDRLGSVAYSADNKQVASGSNDATVKIWDIATGGCIWTFRGHSGWVNSVAFSADGQLASGADDRTIKIWDTAMGSCVQTLEGHSGSVNSVTFSGDGKLASASDDMTIKIWDAMTGACIQTLEGHSKWVSSIIFLGDGKLTSGSDDRTIKVWDIATGTCIQTLEGHSDCVNSVAFSGDGKLASASGDSTIKIWDATIGACIQTHKGHSSMVMSVVFLGDGKQAASGSLDKTIKIWDVATGECIRTLEGHNATVISLSFSGDSKQIVSGSLDDTIKIWDTAPGANVQVFESHRNFVNSIAFSGDAKQVASGSADKTIKIWDSATGSCIQTFEGHSSWVRSVAFSRDDKLVASGSDDETIKIWGRATGTCVQTLHDNNDVGAVAFSGDGKLVASGLYDNKITIWDIATGARVQTLTDQNRIKSATYDDRLVSVAFSRGSKHVASASEGGKVKIWDMATAVLVQTLHVGAVGQLFFDQNMESRLHTNLGTLVLDLESTTNIPLLAEASLQPDSHHAYGIDKTSVWITKDGKPMLWLPSEYRPRVSAVAGSMVAIGCGSGRVWIMQFSEQC